MDIYTILFIISIAVAIFGRALDAYSSKDFMYYAMEEANPLWRDEMGYFSLWKNVAWSAVFIGLCFIPLFIEAFDGYEYITGFMIGGISIIIALLNIEGKGKNRREQIKILSDLRTLLQSDPPQDAINQFFNRLAWTYEGENVNSSTPMNLWELDCTYINNFAWVISTKLRIYEAQQECIAKVCEIARKPEKEWFPK